MKVGAPTGEGQNGISFPNLCRRGRCLGPLCLESQAADLQVGGQRRKAGSSHSSGLCSSWVACQVKAHLEVNEEGRLPPNQEPGKPGSAASGLGLPLTLQLCPWVETANWLEGRCGNYLKPLSQLGHHDQEQPEEDRGYFL